MKIWFHFLAEVCHNLCANDYSTVKTFFKVVKNLNIRLNSFKNQTFANIILVRRECQKISPAMPDINNDE